MSIDMSPVKPPISDVYSGQGSWPLLASDLNTTVWLLLAKLPSNTFNNFTVFLASGKPVDATQELIAMGMCNIGNSFVQGFPGSGSLSRSAVNEASGVRTPLGGLYTGNYNKVYI